MCREVAVTYSSNVEPRATINEELEALEREAMNEASRRERTVSSSSDSDKKESSEPPDYRSALKYVKNEKEDDAKPSSDDQLQPPRYDSVV